MLTRLSVKQVYEKTVASYPIVPKLPSKKKFLLCFLMSNHYIGGHITLIV